MQELVSDIGTIKANVRVRDYFQMKRPFGVYENMFDQSSATEA